MERIKNVLTSSKLKYASKQLEKVYKQIPNTVGCMENINKPVEDGGCGAWCCQNQSPQVLYSEFLNSWSYVLKNWSTDQIIDLVERALRNYFSQKATKGCIFFDSQKRLCKHHNVRCYNCRCYGIIPKEEFKPRYERLRVLYQNDVTADIRDQCNLVKTTNGKEFTKKESDRLWQELIEVEESIGIKKNEIEDTMDGSYLTYHDHLLLQLLGDETLSEITLIKQHGMQEEKDMAIKAISDHLRKNMEKAN